LIEAFVKFKHYNETRPEKLALIGDAALVLMRLNISSTNRPGGRSNNGRVGRAKRIRLIFSTARWRIFCRLCTKVLALTLLQALACGVPAIASDLPVFA